MFCNLASIRPLFTTLKQVLWMHQSSNLYLKKTHPENLQLLWLHELQKWIAALTSNRKNKEFTPRNQSSRQGKIVRLQGCIYPCDLKLDPGDLLSGSGMNAIVTVFLNSNDALTFNL